MLLILKIICITTVHIHVCCSLVSYFASKSDRHVFSAFASTDTLSDKEHDSTVKLSATNCTDFELLTSTGEELAWKYNESFDFTLEWFASANDAHFESLTASLLLFPTFFRNHQAVVGNLLKILVYLFSPGTSVLLDALERKQRPWRRTWSISWHLHSRIG